jgi:molecular chaperone GrpE
MEDKIKKTTKNPKLEELQNKLDEAEIKYKRVLADYQNLERRSRDEKVEIIKFASRNLLERFIPVLDHLQLAQTHLNDKGLEMVIAQYKTTLEEEGVTVIDTNNTTFDPSTMECVEVVDGPKDQVTKTLQVGYQLNGSVIRHAKVNVGNGNAKN